ncbi:cyclic GMP-AMP synthase-like [Pyxicephalus adspersus]|uniref:cyclic GMP-AMP synthase-like n=1 Tax=Pyxicephalus adspersus TaxID=30357 RepID=UPI003B5C6135
MATRPKKQTCNSTESGNEKYSKVHKESEVSTGLQSSKGRYSNADYSEGNGNSQRKTQKSSKNKYDSAPTINDTGTCISSTREIPEKRITKKKSQETIQPTATGEDETIKSLNTKAKETTYKNRRSDMVDGNNTGRISAENSVNDKTEHSIVMNGHCSPNEITSRQRRSKSDLYDVPVSLDQNSCRNKSSQVVSCANIKTEICVANTGARRRNSKVKENEDTGNSARERGEIKSQICRSNCLPNANLSKHLKNVAESLRMKMSDISAAAGKVNNIIEMIIKSERTKSHPLFKSMEKLSTGSYYEKVKISNPNEFDIMLKITFQSYQTIELTSIDESGAFYTLAFKKRKPQAMALYIDDEGNILAKHILDDFRDLVDSVLQQSGKPANLVRKDPSSPAVTLTIPNEPENISVDLVLALEIRQWPEQASNGMDIDKWLGTKEKQKFRKEPCYMVAKQANPAKKDNKETWRISFSNIEKIIMSHHGSDKKCCENEKTKCCRKLCLKLMKYLLEQLKKHGIPRRMNHFCSYHAKTALLHACNQYPNDDDWKLEDLDVCFNRYVEFFQNCLEMCSLFNFFIPSHNLFSSDYIDKASCNYLFNELENQKIQNYPIFLL